MHNRMHTHLVYLFNQPIFRQRLHELHVSKLNGKTPYYNQEECKNSPSQHSFTQHECGIDKARRNWEVLWETTVSVKMMK